MVLGKLPVPGRPTISIIVGQGPTVLAVGAGGGCLDFFSRLSLLFLTPSLWETTRCRLKYYFKGLLSPNQSTILNNPKDLGQSYKMDLDFWDCRVRWI